MALSNRERQARHRARLKGLAGRQLETAEALAMIVEGWQSRRVGLFRELELLETGVMRTGSGPQDDTAETVARVKRYLDELEELFANFNDSTAVSSSVSDGE